MENNFVEENTIRSNILIVNALAKDRGHLINDDFFLAECLSPFASEIEVRSSSTSVENIRKRLSIRAIPIRRFGFLRRLPRIQYILRLLTVRCSGYQDIFMPAFEEVSVLIFMLLHPRKKLHLIYHNNLSIERRNKHPFLWTLFSKMVAVRAASLLVPSRHQADCIKDIYPQIDLNKIFIRPLDQIARPFSRLTWKERSQTIFFLGPLSIHKSIEPLINLIKKDKEQCYHYVLRQIDNIDPKVRIYLDAQPNVDMASGFLDTNEYDRFFREASWIILTHNLLFEGKLSGIFCDAIAAGTPLIAYNMAPHDEFFERFGDMGLLVDYNDPQWCEQFITTDFSSKQDEFQSNMADFRKSCAIDAIRNVYRAALERLNS
ncbi:glycosyltransferase family 1 protein [Candidatus Marinimicrobia bacterium MT.SAG.2]|nr:glycosyltransferase family 1 protein [Candidatus Marinimicrobia bacterium MT.SAG.2]